MTGNYASGLQLCHEFTARHEDLSAIGKQAFEFLEMSLSKQYRSVIIS